MATYYVATTGSNSNTGTESQPWLTIAFAVSTMVAGDTTYVRGGTYAEGEIKFRRSGTQALPIKLLNYPNEAPKIQFDPSSTNVARLYIESMNGPSAPIGWITIEGFEVANGYNGIRFNNLHDGVLRRNWFHDSEFGSGILGNGTRILIDRNIINHNAIVDPTPPGGHGIYCSGRNYTITNNLIYDNRGYGIQHNGSSSAVYNPAVHAGPEFSESQNWVVVHNTFAYSRTSSGIVIWGSLCSNARIENNIFYENAVNGVTSAPQAINFFSIGSSTGIVIRNNLAYATAPGGTGFLSSAATEGVHYTQSGNLVNLSNPNFINAPATIPASPDFRLSAGSAAIDAGLTQLLVTTDFAGVTRPIGSGYDIGAYEFSPADIIPPAAPTGLQVN